jgi:hypothetical protein
MLNLKNTLITITVAIATTTALAYEAFTPKLIIKNMTTETVTFFAPEQVIKQLKAENSNYLSTFTIQALVMDNGYYEEIQPIEISRITLNAEDVLVLNSIPEYLRNQFTTFLSPEEYAQYGARLGLVAPGSYLPDIKPFFHADELKQAIHTKKDIVIFLQKSEWAHVPGGATPRPCTPDEQYLTITKTELVDHTNNLLGVQDPTNCPTN